MNYRSFYVLGTQLKTKLISPKVKISLYKSLIRPVVIYGRKCWKFYKVEDLL